MRTRTVIAAAGIAALTVMGAAGTAAAKGGTDIDLTKIAVDVEAEVIEAEAEAEQYAGVIGKGSNSVANQQVVSVAGENDARGVAAGAGFTNITQENPTVIFSPLW